MKKEKSQSNRLEIRFYEGYKGKETPRSVVIGDRQFEIDSVLDRKRVFDERTGKSSEVFTCRMEGKLVRLIVHESGRFEIVYL